MCLKISIRRWVNNFLEFCTVIQKFGYFFCSWQQKNSSQNNAKEFLSKKNCALVRFVSSWILSVFLCVNLCDKHVNISPPTACAAGLHYFSLKNEKFSKPTNCRTFASKRAFWLKGLGHQTNIFWKANNKLNQYFQYTWKLFSNF